MFEKSCLVILISLFAYGDLADSVTLGQVAESALILKQAVEANQKAEQALKDAKDEEAKKKAEEEKKRAEGALKTAKEGFDTLKNRYLAEHPSGEIIAGELTKANSENLTKVLENLPNISQEELAKMKELLKTENTDFGIVVGDKTIKDATTLLTSNEAKELVSKALNSGDIEALKNLLADTNLNFPKELGLSLSLDKVNVFIPDSGVTEMAKAIVKEYPEVNAQIMQKAEIKARESIAQMGGLKGRTANNRSDEIVAASQQAVSDVINGTYNRPGGLVAGKAYSQAYSAAQAEFNQVGNKVATALGGAINKQLGARSKTQAVVKPYNVTQQTNGPRYNNGYSYGGVYDTRTNEMIKVILGRPLNPY
jgi:hypothetical protein